MRIYTDGGSRGNPGPAAAGYVLRDKSGGVLEARGMFLGRSTNNVAEYAGVIGGLEAALRQGAQRVQLFSDSELVVRQIAGQYRVKSDALKGSFARVMELLGRFGSWQVSHIRREQNREADGLVNRALDVGRDVEGQVESEGSPGKPIRLGVLISGGGRTMMNIHKEINAGRLNAEIAVVISSRSKAGGVDKARAAGLEVKIIRKKDYAGIDEFSNALENALAEVEVDLVVQAGWLCLWKIPARYEQRVMNIHPALLPSFGGQGMWGHHVHEAVLRAGCKVSGCTVHFCTNEYDKGAIIVQRCCEVKGDDDADSLAARVFEEECIAYPEAIRLFEQGRIKVEDGVAKITPGV